MRKGDTCSPIVARRWARVEGQRAKAETFCPTRKVSPHPRAHVRVEFYWILTWALGCATSETRVPKFLAPSSANFSASRSGRQKG